MSLIRTVIDDPHDRRLALGATGALAVFNRAGVLEAADVHVARRLGALVGEHDDSVLLAAALAVRATRIGAVCVDLRAVAATSYDRTDATAGIVDEVVTELPWPELEDWVERVRTSALVREQILRAQLREPRSELGLRFDLYLDRYWHEEGQVCAALVTRAAGQRESAGSPVSDRDLLRVFPADVPVDPADPDGPKVDFTEQRDAVRAAVGRSLTVLTGGPGTGKTTTVAGLLALLAERHQADQGVAARIALCAPTGKAAARLQEAVAGATAQLRDSEDRQRLADLKAVTVHKLLGWRPETSTRFRHDRSHRLPHDIVVVDETSMVSLTMMARLLEAVRDDALLVLVGDPDQLSSVEAGAVLGDLVKGFGDDAGSPVERLRTPHRYGEHIGALAEALRVGDPEAVLGALRAGSEEVEWIIPDDEAAMATFEATITEHAVALVAAARAGDGAASLVLLNDHRLLCAHRRGPYGVEGWNRTIEQRLAEELGMTRLPQWYPGRPVIVTANDSGLRLNNGDTGVTVQQADGRLRVLLDGTEGGRDFATTRLSAVETLHAMTVHKSQGSQALTVSVVIPPASSPLLTRELFYTAVTRAQERVRVIGTEAGIRAAVMRQVQRPSGLQEEIAEALRRTGA